MDEQLIKFLADVHAIEVQALAQLRRAPDIAGDPTLAQAFAKHLEGTQEHERSWGSTVTLPGHSAGRRHGCCAGEHGDRQVTAPARAMTA
jgi:ferritin-like metal-binding protein YciE